MGRTDSIMFTILGGAEAETGAFLEQDSFFLCRPSEISGRSGLPTGTYLRHQPYLLVSFLSINSTCYLTTWPTHLLFRAGASTFGLGALPPFCDNYDAFDFRRRKETTVARACLLRACMPRRLGRNDATSPLRVAISCVNDEFPCITRRTAPNLSLTLDERCRHFLVHPPTRHGGGLSAKSLCTNTVICNMGSECLARACLPLFLTRRGKGGKAYRAAFLPLAWWWWCAFGGGGHGVEACAASFHGRA